MDMDQRAYLCQGGCRRDQRSRRRPRAPRRPWSTHARRGREAKARRGMGRKWVEAARGI